jgi:hypothetical protein
LDVLAEWLRVGCNRNIVDGHVVFGHTSADHHAGGNCIGEMEIYNVPWLRIGGIQVSGFQAKHGRSEGAILYSCGGCCSCNGKEGGNKTKEHSF